MRDAKRTRQHRDVRLGLVGWYALIGLAAGPAPAAHAADPTPIPQLAQWESNMTTYGQQHCILGTLDHTYYDAERVYYQIAAYTGNTAVWQACAGLAEQVYRDGYVLPNNGSVPGYWNFPAGMRLDYERTGDLASKDGVVLLSQNAAYAHDRPLEWTASADLSREVAYAINSYIDAEAMGEPRRARRQQLVDQAYGHLDQWFVRFAWPGPWQQSPQETARLSPFMVGLTAHALIKDWEETQDPRLIPALKRAADWMWANAWIPASEAMWYEFPDANQPCCQASGPAADLNLLIAPMYAFLYQQTGETTYRDQGDALFAGGVKSAYLGGGKQFNQNYWWSFDYVTWRQAGPIALSGLVGFWPLDDGSGTTAADASGNNNTGTLINGPAWTAGRISQALSFDGINEYVNVPHAPALNAYPLTLAAWFKTNSTSGVRGIVNKYVVGSFNGYQVFLNDGKLCAWYLRDAATYVYGGGGCTFSVPGYNDDRWHHVAYVVDDAGGRLYVDGVLKGSQPWTGTPGAPSTTQPVHLAHYPGAFGGAEYFPGLLDDVRLYNRALTATEITALYDSAPPLDTTPPTIAITAPLSGTTVTGTITVSASASDAVSVAGVQFQLNGAPLGAEDTASPYAVSWDATTAASGAHTLTAVARDAAGNTATSAAVSVTVADTSPPTVAITAPLTGAILGAGTTSVSATASDNVGIAGVQFMLDGASLGAELTSAPYTISFDTTAVLNGSHTLTAVARDAAGNITTSAGVTVTVDRVPPTLTALSTCARTTGATLSWQTDEAADAAVEYGTTTAYGGLVSDGTPGTTHTLALSGLAPNTTYHYRLKSTDSAGNSAASGDRLLITLP